MWKYLTPADEVRGSTSILTILSKITLKLFSELTLKEKCRGVMTSIAHIRKICMEQKDFSTNDSKTSSTMKLEDVCKWRVL